MELGTFSLSLTVSDIEKSLTFYQKLGFTVVDGGHMNQGFPDNEQMKWRIIENASVKIGLFQGMFEDNILTFNPKDVLALQAQLQKEGVTFTKEATANAQDGFVSAFLKDPDGNVIMLDQM